MSDVLCRRLDDYLDRTLTGAEKLAFLEHLEECRACRAAVGDHERLALLLRRAVVRIEPAPVGLANRVGAELRRRQRRQILRWTAAVAALVVFGTMSAWWALSPHVGENQPDGIAQNEPTTSPAMDVRSPEVNVTFQADGPLIVMPIKTERLNVTIYWVYSPVGGQTGQKNEESPTEPSERNGT